jgi:F-type H+-transporting ATPase subunit a
VTGQAVGLLAEKVPFPPSVEDFYLPGWFYPWITKFTVMVWIAVAVIIVYFMVTYRDPRIVPTKKQWIAESIYGFARNNVSNELLGSKDGARFAPYLASLFCFLLLTNLLGIIPPFLMSPNAHIAFPVILALITWVMYNYVGIRKHGAGKYFKAHLFPAGVPPVMYILITPLELISTFILRPFTLALRLFANMFAGHVILLVFTLGGFVLLGANSWFIKPVSLVSWAMAIALTFFEALIAVLQAYVFILLTASYVQGSLADDH